MIYSRIDKDGFINHLDHKIEIDYGRKGQDMEYTIWCINCNQAVSTTLVVKSQ